MNDRSFRYQSRSKEDWRERANMKGGQFDSYIKPAYKMYKVKDGKNLLRILPPTWPKAKHYGYDIYVNFGIGPDNQAYLSLSKMLGKPDPIAEARQVAESEGDEALVKALRPTYRVLMWVIDRNDEEEGPLLWPAPFTVDKAFINLARDQDTGAIVEIDHPEEGCDIRFYREGTGMTTKYDASKMRLMEAAPVADNEKQQDKWLQFIAENQVPDCLQFYDYGHISKVFSGATPRPKDEDPEETPRKAAKPIEPEPEDDPVPAPRRVRPRAAEPEQVAFSAKAEEDEVPKSGSIRDRIRRRHQTASQPAEED